MRILVVGGGGREHAIVWKLAQSKHQPVLFAAPGNPGIAELATCVNIPVDAVQKLADFAEQEKIDLTVVGPEVALSAGIVDEFQSRGLKIFGPSKAAALIESSKAFAKEIMVEADIPTASYATFTDVEQARAYLSKQHAPIVVKADGLAAGKGVVVAETIEEALVALDSMMQEGAFGEAGNRVVIEEFLSGQEATVMAFVDGKTIRLMAPAQDHKPVFNSDRGPNTGGMGTYSPVPAVDEALLQEVESRIIRPAVEALAKRGSVYRGVLYTGLMLTEHGPKVIEFNARFGDPETQVVLPRLQNDLVDVMVAVTEDQLDEITLDWSEQATVCVIIASEGYPGDYRKGDVIEGLDEREAAASGEQPSPSVVYHAGTREENGMIVTAGGRVLGVTGFGDTIADAKVAAYQRVQSIRFSGMHYRTDISDKAGKL